MRINKVNFAYIDIRRQSDGMYIVTGDGIQIMKTMRYELFEQHLPTIGMLSRHTLEIHRYRMADAIRKLDNESGGAISMGIIYHSMISRWSW